MISAVVPPTPQSLPLVQGSATPVSQPSVREMAAAGYFRAIALWINEPLAPQGIFVQVQADRPGCLKLVVEFERTPIKERLLKFLCHRVWLLNSELIEGIYVVARPVGRRSPLWQQRIRIVTPALKRRQTAVRVAYPHQSESPIPPQIVGPRPKVRHLTEQRVKALRAFVLTGSAVAAFVMGCLLEVISSGVSPRLPAFSAQRSPSPQAVTADYPTGQDTGAMPVLHSTSDRPPRPTVVDAALEPVGVIPHQKPTPIPEDQVTLLFGGDISLDDLNYDHLTEAGGLFADVADYFEADVSLVNLATPLTPAATNLEEGLRDRSRTDAADLLVESGIDIVNLTHSGLMQHGAEGLADTLNTLDSRGLYRIGAGRNAMEARRPEVIDVKGKRIAYLSYAMGGNDAAFDGSALRERAGADNAAIAKEVERFKSAAAVKERAGFNAQNMPDIVKDIQALRDDVDWIVVNFRWVDHITEQPHFTQTNLARLAIDQGADVVVGYHPTVIQGGEIYKGRPIAYSLGDFVFRADEPVNDQDSAMLKVSLQEEQMKVEFVPVRVRNSRPKTLTGRPGQAMLDRIAEASTWFDQPMTSPVVIDLNAQEPPTADTLDPDSPFVSPDDADLLPVEAPEPEASEPEEPEAEAIPEPTLEAPSADDLEPDVPATAEPSPGEDEVDLPVPEELDSDLLEWGPKISPDQKDFQPIPQNRSGATGTEEARQLNPEQSAQEAKPAASEPEKAESPTWNDQVPAQPQIPALEPTPKSDTISPHGEPLVGPLGSLMPDAPKPTLDQATPLKEAPSSLPFEPVAPSHGEAAEPSEATPD
jgi:poly-gamma-glutamate capsule biosynthesis protein CapA/YwtB (metallophosphatase superfamily)